MPVRELDSLHHLLTACADPTRLRLLNLLRDGETCVCDLVAVLKVPQPKVSRHLATLRNAGLVSARREGAWMHYQLATPTNAAHKRLLTCLATCLSDVAELKKDLKSLKRTGPACCGGACC